MHRLLRPASIALVAAMALAACSTAGAGSGSASGAPATPVPSAPAPSEPAPTAPAEPSASPAPSDRPSDGPIVVDLETATGHDVTMEILDDGGHVVAARSGHPGDGASVPFGTVVARNLDARTVEFTFSDTPGDAELGLFVNEAATLVLVIRPERDGGDAIAFDRVVVVEFDSAVAATDLKLGMQEGLDTAG